MKIGSVNLTSPVILAPMAGVSDYPFRKIVKSFGAGMVCSEMVASRAVIESLKREEVRKRLFFFDSSKEDAPVSIQLVGNDPLIMAEAAKFNEQLGASVIDINMGCPVKKVVNTDAGASLMKNELLAAQIIRATVKSVSIPVTVKMRLGWDSQHLNASNIAKIAESEGASAIIIHGRTRSQFYEGTADWISIGNMKQVVSIPVIGNGDVKSVKDASELITLCDGIMVGRGACGRPWLLMQIETFLQSGSFLSVEKDIDTVLQTIRKHLVLIIDTYGEYKGIRLARKHLDWYSKGLAGSAAFRSAVNTTETKTKLYELVDRFFAGNIE
ncbi:MAG: tRNA dihydrouridine synthase DusB [Holosporales bacterium]|jgi:tRNA-dihydrouridine synthase B|nr:tRNA dihydrouridine synthase DusB [Holosporales bacterium]